jgi:hypothetical protein
LKILSPEMTSPIYAHDHDNLSRSVFVIDVDAKPIIASAAWEYVDADESIGTREKTADCSNEAAHATGARKLLEAVNGSQIWTGGCVGASELKNRRSNQESNQRTNCDPANSNPGARGLPVQKQMKRYAGLAIASVQYQDGLDPQGHGRRCPP